MKNVGLFSLLLLLTACSYEQPSQSIVEETFSNMLIQQMALVNYNHHTRRSMSYDAIKAVYAKNIRVRQSGNCHLKKIGKQQILDCPIHFEWDKFKVNGIIIPAQSGDTAMQFIQIKSIWEAWKQDPKKILDL